LISGYDFRTGWATRRGEKQKKAAPGGYLSISSILSGYLGQLVSGQESGGGGIIVDLWTKFQSIKVKSSREERRRPVTIRYA